MLTTRFLTAIVLAAWGGSLPALFAQDAAESTPAPAPAESKAQPDDITGNSPGDDVTDITGDERDPAQVLRDVAQTAEEASGRLQAGQLDHQTRALQQRVLDDVEKLLQQVKQTGVSDFGPAGQEPDSPGAEPADQELDPMPTAGSGTGQGGAQRAADQSRASESVERTTGGAALTEAERRRNLANSVWGHLPPRVRDELRQSFSERFLPRYEALVRRYYEALAEDQDR